MQSIGNKLATSGGIGPGFDVLRIVLATSVVAWHSDSIVTATSRLDGMPVVWFPGYAILAMFFSLSGFLIAGSAVRLRLSDFLINRGLRIFPALALEIMLSAFILGPLVSDLPLSQYLTDPLTWRYLTNIVSLMNYELPGVFLHNPLRLVNVSLWTVPYEFLCYAVMSALMVLGWVKRAKPVVLAAAVIVVAGLAMQWLGAAHGGAGTVAVHAERVLAGHQSRLLLSFLLGIALYAARDRIPYSVPLAAIAVAVCAFVAWLGPAQDIGFPVVNLLAAPALVYLMGFIGVSQVWTPAFLRRGDYSYGIYLYGYPIQQLMVHAFPAVRDPALQFCLAFPAVALLACVSWHAIEKPVLRLRKRFSFVARARLTEGPVAPAPVAPTPAGALQPAGAAE